MFRWIPREEAFFEMFGQAAQNVQRGALALKEMMENYRDLVLQAEGVKKIEHDGDTITHDIVKKLNQTFITPFDREDIYALTCALDDVLDLIEAVADRMVVFKVKEPTAEARKLADLIVQSTDQIVQGIALLGKSQDLSRYCVEINRLENEADRITRDAIARLFEKQEDPITVIKWKEIYENLEDATDRCEDVANVLENISLKNA